MEPIPSSPVKVGDILAEKYQIERVLGAGGMGVVVQAMHLELRERVALKFLLPNALARSELVERFLREARAAVRIQSEHVARISDVGRLENGAPYMVMEFLNGSDLSVVLQQNGPLSPALAVDYVLQACEALAEAHSLGIIHRDLKPANLFLIERKNGAPFVKVLDFGIAKVMEEKEQQAALTNTAQPMGSPLYMSPEQMRSAKGVGAHTDIWSLGVILYELLSGKTPYDADTIHALCAAILTEPPIPLAQRCPELPPGLVEVVMRCLEKAPEARFSTIEALATALAPHGSADALASLARLTPAPRSRSAPPPSTGAPSGVSSLASSTPAISSVSVAKPPAGGGKWALLLLPLLLVVGLVAARSLWPQTETAVPAAPSPPGASSLPEASHHPEPSAALPVVSVLPGAPSSSVPPVASSSPTASSSSATSARPLPTRPAVLSPQKNNDKTVDTRHLLGASARGVGGATPRGVAGQ